jgi:hypothetical protein
MDLMKLAPIGSALDFVRIPCRTTLLFASVTPGRSPIRPGRMPKVQAVRHNSYHHCDDFVADVNDFFPD